MKTLHQLFGLLAVVLPLTLHGAGNNWMAPLHADLYLSQLSIPGTHESGALYESFSGTAKCQNLTIADQLNIGVRFLDIRCRHLNNSFVIHHGSVYQNQNFDDVLNAVIGFLNSNPTEAVIMSVKEEYNASGNTRTFEQTFDSYVAKNPSKWNLASGIPTLAQARGKITLFRRFSASSTPKGIDASVWPDNTTFTYGSLRVQDNYVVNDNNVKWNQITSLLNEAFAGGTMTLYVNFTSGYRPGAFGIPNIPTVSNDINQRIASYFTSRTYGRCGIIPMDFVDANRVSLIYVLSYNPIANGTYKVLNYNSGKALDVAGVSTADGANVDQWTYFAQSNQKWTFTSLGDNYYKVLALHSGKALDVEGWSTADGANVDQWSWNGGANQIWKLVPNTDGTYRVLNKYSRKALDVFGYSTVDGANVGQWTYGGGGNQRWWIQAP